MAKKKNAIEATNEEITTDEVKESNIEEIVTENKKEPQYEVGDNVTVRGIGNSNSDGTGMTIIEKAREVRRIAKIIEGKLYPYEIGDPYGSTIGYFKEESIYKLPNY